GVCDFAFMSQDLLSSHGDGNRLFSRQGVGFIHGVGMERLSAAQNCRQSLNCGTDDIVVRLLSGQRATPGLRMKTKHQGTRGLSMKTFGHHSVPNLASRAILGDLLKKIIVSIEEE